MDVEALVARLEAAVGPDRGIDADIWTIETRREYPDPNDPDILWDVHARIVAHLKAGGEDPECPNYTSSINAALTLVPEGYRVDISMGIAGCYADVGKFASGRRASPPLALCIAALKARQAAPAASTNTFPSTLAGREE